MNWAVFRLEAMTWYRLGDHYCGKSCCITCVVSRNLYKTHQRGKRSLLGTLYLGGKENS
jgi:hypothetical protein